jgi:urease beta subunit
MAAAGTRHASASSAIHFFMVSPSLVSLHRRTAFIVRLDPPWSDSALRIEAQASTGNVTEA